MIFFDTESVGLVGPTVLIQWAEERGPIYLHEVWREPARATLELIEYLADVDAVGGFNLVFDWFHLQRLYCILDLLPPTQPPTIDGWLAVERDAVFGPCVKPRSAFDVMLHARRGPLQSLMERDPIRVKRVPRLLAPVLADELAERIQFDGIYFERRRDGYGWQVDDREDDEFPNVVLRFGASGGLKPLARHLLEREVIDFPVPDDLLPSDERGFDPFSRSWIPLLSRQVAYWGSSVQARRYASDDVELTRSLWEHFGRPVHGDDDSVLACLIGSCRWRGWAFDHGLMAEIRDEAATKLSAAPWALNPHEVRRRLHAEASTIERLALKSTKDAVLKKIVDDPDWNGSGVQRVAREARAARAAKKELDVAEALLSVGRAHFDMKPIGALSGRMSGSGGVNAQGIPSKKKNSRMRTAFTLADGEVSILDAGDFDQFEVSLAVAIYKDATLDADLRSGKKVHALFGSSVYGKDYDSVKNDAELYGRSKNAVFGSLYGAQPPKLAETLGLDLETVEAGLRRFEERYPGVGAARARIAERFCSMRQPNGIGTRVEWHEPADYVESLFGYRRYFTLENSVCRALFNLAESPPSAWRSRELSQVRVSRRVGRVQTPGGAVQSALFACAFGIQASNMRQAGNHEIQSSGAQITKRLQCRIWEHQPPGIHPWRVQPLQIHDEIQCPRRPEVDLRPTVTEVLDFYRPSVPLIGMKWCQGLRTWEDK